MEESSGIIRKDSFSNNEETESESPLEEVGFGERERRRADEKKKKLEESEKKRKLKEKEEKERQDREKSIVEFQYYLDFGALTILGSVFFVTCIVGFLSGVSSKSLSIRTVVSFALASIVVYIFRKIAKFYFTKELDKRFKKDKSDNEENKEK